MMCVKTYKVKDSSDFDTWDEWVMFVNENIKYAMEESFIDDYVGKCCVSELPSFHPYWSYEVNKGDIATLEDLEKKYKECRKNPDKIKYYFNKDTSLSTIEEKINKIKQKMSLYGARWTAQQT